MELTEERCEIGLALRYAFWEYPGVRRLIDDAFSDRGMLRVQLEADCSPGMGELVTPHQYWVCAGHADLIPVIDHVVSRDGETPLSLALTEE